MSRAKQSEKLGVEVEARSNREAMQGRFDIVSVEFDKMAFPDIQVRKDKPPAVSLQCTRINDLQSKSYRRPVRIRTTSLVRIIYLPGI